jgi:hypothetical protein
MADATECVWQHCTLPAVEQPRRVAEFDRLFAGSVLRCTRVATTRLDLVLTSAAESAARGLAAREADCCSSFTFDFDSAGLDVVMSIVVPPSHAKVLDGLTVWVSAASAAGAAQ